MRRECVAANFRSGPAEERQRQIAVRWWKGHILHDAGWWGTCAKLDPVPGVFRWFQASMMSWPTSHAFFGTYLERC
jgi:hypothetical protein